MAPTGVGWGSGLDGWWLGCFGCFGCLDGWV